jgi:hypothetical protein
LKVASFRSRPVTTNVRRQLDTTGVVIGLGDMASSAF